jgi:hypothetical protein
VNGTHIEGIVKRLTAAGPSWDVMVMEDGSIDVFEVQDGLETVCRMPREYPQRINLPVAEFIAHAPGDMARLLRCLTGIAEMLDKMEQETVRMALISPEAMQAAVVTRLTTGAIKQWMARVL